MVKVAVILSGCGHLDGSEIREAILTLLSLDKVGVRVKCFAPDQEYVVMNHITQQAEEETRNVMVESARITRGDIYDLNDIQEEDFDAIVLPGGYGSAKNLSDIAGGNNNVIATLQNALIDFWKNKKPIAALCIAPALVVAALRKHASVVVTIGDDKDNLISRLGGKHIKCEADNYYHDQNHNIFSSPAYMLDAPLSEISIGIDLLIKAMVNSII